MTMIVIYFIIIAIAYRSFLVSRSDQFSSVQFNEAQLSSSIPSFLQQCYWEMIAKKRREEKGSQTTSSPWRANSSNDSWSANFNKNTQVQ